MECGMDQSARGDPDLGRLVPPGAGQPDGVTPDLLYIATEREAPSEVVAVREKIFSPFFSSKGTGGTGLGLFVANNAVERHHGRIQVTSRPGEGTRFTIRIPRATRPPEEAEHSTSPAPNPTGLIS